MSRDQQLEPQTIRIHVILVLAGLTITVITTCFCHYATLKASQKLHNKMTEAVLKAPILFYDKNHPGQIKTRFSKDVQQMDQPSHFVAAIQVFLFAVSATLVPLVMNYWVALAFVPLCVSFLYFGRVCAKSFPEIKQWEAMKRGPVYSHFCETVRGLEVVRSSKTEKRFVRQFYRCEREN